MLPVDMSVEDWRRVFRINVDGIFVCSRFALPEMLKNGELAGVA